MGLIIYYAYQLTGHFGLSVLIFSVIVRIIIFPVNLAAHNNSICLLKLQPALERLRRQYSGQRDALNAAQYDLFKKEKYSPFVGLIPLFIQLFLLIGVLQVMYHPLQHVLHYDGDFISQMVHVARNVHNVQAGAGEQLVVLELLYHPENIYGFRAALSGFYGYNDLILRATAVDMHFLGFDLGAMPSLGNPSILLVVPLFSGITALAFCLFQNKYSPGALSQGLKTNLGLTVFTVVFSIYFALVTPVGVGFYWIISNVLSIFVILILEKWKSPKRLASEALAEIEANRKTPEQLHADKEWKKVLSVREKLDATRFNSAKKELVFYALTGGQYKYYKNIIEHILENSDIVIHYLTNDPDDAVFSYEGDKLTPYYAGQQKTISLLLRLDADILATTVQDLQVYHMKRSIVRNDIEYIHIPHGPASLHLTAREAAYDHFDTFFCVGPHQAAEIRRREEMAGLPKKTLVKAGYGLHDQLIKMYNELENDGCKKPQILIAPSWQTDNILDICIMPILDNLLGNNQRIIIRPHPQYVRIFPERIAALEEKYSVYIKAGELVLDLKLLDSSSIFLSDMLITDWSGIAFEFSYATNKPSVFVNTPMKILNPNYAKYELEVLDISLRDQVGVSIDLDNISSIQDTVNHLLKARDSYSAKINETVEKYLFYPGRNGEAGGQYIIKKLRRDWLNASTNNNRYLKNI